MDNREIRQAIDPAAGNGPEDDEEESDEEQEQHGLEDLGEAFEGPLTELQEKYKDKLQAKLKQVRCALVCIVHRWRSEVPNYCGCLTLPPRHILQYSSGSRATACRSGGPQRHIQPRWVWASVYYGVSA